MHPLGQISAERSGGLSTMVLKFSVHICIALRICLNFEKIIAPYLEFVFTIYIEQILIIINL